MKPHLNISLLIVASLGTAAMAADKADEVLTVPLPAGAPKIARSFGVRPLAFEPNVGQTDAEVKFLARGKGYQLFLTEREAVMVLNSPAPEGVAKRLGLRQLSAALPAFGIVPEAPGDWRSPRPGGEATAPLEPTAPAHVLRMRLVGAKASPSVRGDEELQGKVNYFIGNDPARWRTNVPTFGRVQLAELYPGIDLVYYGNEGRLEYDFVLAPGVDPNQITLEFDGADRIEVDAHGDLIAWVDGRAMRWRKPVVYQETDGQRIEIAGDYRLNDASLTYQAEAPRRIGFELAAYDQSKALVIDPVLIYSTYLGGSAVIYGSESASGVAADSRGNAYVVGETWSLDFPTRNPLQPTPQGGWNAFVTKLNPAGELVFSTYLGEAGEPAVATDAQGNVYVVGGTGSPNFPLVNPLQAVLDSGGSTFVTILGSNGSAITFSTYLGGNGGDGASCLALDPSGNIYVGGVTSSTDFPVQNALQPQHSGGDNSREGFVTKFEAGGKSIIYSTYYGGTGYDAITSIAADADGNAYISGGTSSEDLWLKNAYQPFNNGLADFFYAKLLPDGSELVYASYFGGAGPEGTPWPKMALGPDGSLWLAGRCNQESTGLATPNAFQTEISAYANTILARFDAGDGSLQAATYLNSTRPYGIAVSSAGEVLIGGKSSGPPALSPPWTALPLVDPLQSQTDDGDEGFVVKFSPDCSRLLFSTYIGGAGPDGVASLALDPNGNLLVVGGTQSTNFPVVSPLQANLRGSDDIFVAKISFAEVLKISRTGQTVSLSWPASATNYVLEATTSLPAVSWTTVTNSPTVIGRDQSVQLPITGNASFFRLRQP